MSRSPRIALVVAWPLRDLPGLTLTAFELCQRGATCFLVPHQDGLADVWALAPDFVVLPSIRQYLAPRVQSMSAAGMQFGVLDVEQTVFRSHAEYAGTLWKERELTRKARCICMWGPDVTEYTLDEGIFGSDQVRVTGCPRFDFYAEPLADVYRTAVRPDSISDRPLILLNTNFTIANFNRLEYDLMAARFEQNFGVSREQVDAWREEESAALNETIDLAARLAIEYPDIDVVLRPHPQERVETYRERLGDRSNVVVTNEGPVMSWLFQAAAVIQRSSTTAIEAALAGVPAISPEWIPDAHRYPTPEAVSLDCADFPTLRSMLDDQLAGSLETPPETKAKIDDVIASSFFRNDGLAHRRVADAILASFDPATVVDPAACRRLLYGLHHSRPVAHRALDRMRYHLRLPPNWSFRQMRVVDVPVADDDHTVSRISLLVEAIANAKRSERPVVVRVDRADAAGAYVAKSHKGRSVVMTPTDSQPA